MTSLGLSYVHVVVLVVVPHLDEGIPAWEVVRNVHLACEAASDNLEEGTHREVADSHQDLGVGKLMAEGRRQEADTHVEVALEGSRNAVVVRRIDEEVATRRVVVTQGGLGVAAVDTHAVAEQVLGGGDVLVASLAFLDDVRLAAAFDTLMRGHGDGFSGGFCFCCDYEEEAYLPSRWVATQQDLAGA